MGEAHGSEAETATLELPNGKLGATLCRGRSPPSDTQCGWARSAGGVGSHHQGAFCLSACHWPVQWQAAESDGGFAESGV